MISDIEKIKRVLTNYAEGCFYADEAKLKSAFCKNASMAGFIAGNFRQMSADAYIEAIVSQDSMADRQVQFGWEIGSVEVCDGIASAVLNEHGFEGMLEFCDHFHLIKTDGEWRIIFKLFTSVS